MASWLHGFESQSCLQANGSTKYSGDAAALGRDQEGFSPFLTTSQLDPTPEALRHWWLEGIEFE